MTFKPLFPFIFLLTFCVSCSHKTNTEQSVATVKVDTVKPYQLNITASFPGKIKAASDVDLSFRVSGTLQSMPKKQGAFVRKGEVVAVMDDRDYAIQLSATEAEYYQIKGEAERVFELYAKQSVSANDYEKAKYGLQQITAKKEAHTNALADTRIYAPFDGYIQDFYFIEGETVSAGMPVLSMINAGLPEVEINIPSRDYMKRNNFDSFYCTLELFPNVKYPLQLVGINQKANLNQLYTMRLKMQAMDEQVMPTPGMTTMVYINYDIDESQRKQLPSSAIFIRDNASSVWIYHSETQTVSLQSVVIEEVCNDGSIIVNQGVKEGDLIITAGVHQLEEGQKVKVLPPVSSTNIGGLL